MEDRKDPRQPTHKATLSEEEAIASLLRLAGPRPPVPPERRERVRLAVRAYWRQSVRSRRRRRVAAWIAGSLAAAAAVLVAIGLSPHQGLIPFPADISTAARIEVVKGDVRSQLSGMVKPGDTIPGADELQTASDGRIALRLTNGTSLRLDTGTRLQLLPDSVLVLHQGSVYVDAESAGAGASSVEIRTSLGTVTDMGTQFEVWLRNDSMRIRVRDGLVGVSRGARAYRAEAGQQLLANAGGDVIMSNVPRHGEAWDWALEIAPSFDLEGRSLEEFLIWVSRETGWRVQYEEGSIAEGAPTLVLHGSIEGLRPDEAPAAVLPTCGLRHRVEGGTMTIGRLPDRE